MKRTLVVLALVLGGCDVHYAEQPTPREVQKDSDADYAALKLRLDALEHRVQDDATLVDKRLDALEKELR
jgi:tetrahydromethanopterin S-methyltransferase subunit G